MHNSRLSESSFHPTLLNESPLQPQAEPPPQQIAETGMILQRGDGTIQACNPNAAKILGYSIEQISNQTTFDLLRHFVQEDGSALPPERFPANIVLETRQACLNVVLYFYKPQGALIELLVNAEPLFQGNETTISGVIITLTQINELTLIKSSFLQQTQEQFRHIIESLQDVFWVIDPPNKQVLYVSPAYEKIWGYPCANLYANPDHWLVAIHPDDQERIQEASIKTLQFNGEFNEEYRVIRPDGELRWIRDRGFPIPSKDNTIHRVAGIAEDITERKKTEEALKVTEAKLQSLFEANIIGILFGDIYGYIKGANDEFLRIVGYNREELKSGSLDWLNLTPPEYLPLDEFQITIARERGACEAYEKQYLHKQGHRVPVLVGYSLIGEQREEFVAFILDLTQQKQAQEAIRQSEERLRVAFDSIPYVIVIYDPQRRLQFVNQEGIRRSGKSLIEMVGRRDEDLFPPEITDPYLPTLEKAIKTRTTQTVEITQTLPPVGTYTLIVNYVPLLNEIGEIHQILGITYDISDRKRVEEFLEAKNRQITNIFNSITDGFVSIDSQWRYTYVNSKAEQLVGKSKDELIGNSIWEIFPELRTSPTYTYLHKSLAEQVTVEYEEYFPLFDRWFAVRLYPSSQGLSIYFLDITDRQQVAEDLKNSEARFRTLAESMPQIVWSANPDGQVDYYNQRWTEFSGISQANGQGWGWQPVLHPDDEQLTLDTWTTAVQTGNVYECEHRLRRANGEYRWYLSRGIPAFDSEGNIIKWYGTATDIHEQKQIQAERQALLIREQAARAEAESANRIKDEFLATLSHELRTPMNAMLGWASLLKSCKLNQATTDRALETIERNTKLLNQLIEDILDVSRIIQGKLSLHCFQVRLISVIEEAIETVRSATIAKNITLVKQGMDLPIFVWGDMNRLQQVVWNLLTNAVKFTPEGGQITVKLSVIEPTNCPPHCTPSAQIQVIDTGVGISPEFLPFVFERFRQADGSTTRSHGGLGLGLAIVRHLVEMHGGTVHAESPGVGQGATFTVQLPLFMGETLPTPDQKSPSTTAEALLLSGLKVLIVEDEADTRELIRLSLEEQGAIVTDTARGQQALEQMQKIAFDLLVSDLGMPEMSGNLLIETIRTSPSILNSQIPAIALTAYASASDREKALKSGFQIHLAKPIDPFELVNAIANLIKQ